MNVIKKTSVRVRFAPSPTGHLHIGGLRTALFNWLFAQHMDGVFLLRIEDTDVERSKEEYKQAIFQAFAWVGIVSDEKPLQQSERFSLYQKVAEQLVHEGKAYRCLCTPEEIEARIRVTGKEYHGGYDGFCRTRNIDAQALGAGIRFIVPQEGAPFVWNDLIRGPISIERNQLDDFIIIRSDGSPIYNFCVVVDDHASGITHVIRGEDHISNTPKQIALYEALHYAVPHFAHIPMILGPDGNKLSKRDGAVDVVAYRAMGYLPDALLNYIVRLGWAHGDQEIFTVSQMIKDFSLEAVGKKPSIFDFTKLEWLNSHYLRNKNPQELVDAIQEGIDQQFIHTLSGWSNEVILRVVGLYQERVKTLVELRQEVLALYHGPVEYSLSDIDAHITETTGSMLIDIASLIKKSDHAADSIKQYAKEHGLKLGNIAQPLRIALTGGASSPGIFELISLLGSFETECRIKKLCTFLESSCKSKE